MNWKDTLFPWGALKKAQKENAELIKHGFEQTKKIVKLEYEMKAARLHVTVMKADMETLKATIEALPKRNEKGRFTSKSGAEAVRKPKKSLPQKEDK
jgi:hypothetical protein